MFRILLLASIGGLFSFAALAADFTEEDIKALALEAILENPDILIEASEIIQKRQEEARAAQIEAGISAYLPEIQQASDAPVRGNPDGDITIVEFFDYNCGYCKSVMGSIDRLIEDDPNIRVVYREWPILSEASLYAAHASISAHRQGVYSAFHKAVMSTRRVNQDAVKEIAKSVGMDVAQMEADIAEGVGRSHIERSQIYAEAFGFTGTPAFVVGSQLIGGAVPYEHLVQAIAEERKKQ